MVKNYAALSQMFQPNELQHFMASLEIEQVSHISEFKNYNLKSDKKMSELLN